MSSVHLIRSTGGLHLRRVAKSAVLTVTVSSFDPVERSVRLSSFSLLAPLARPRATLHKSPAATSYTVSTHTWAFLPSSREAVVRQCTPHKNLEPNKSFIVLQIFMLPVHSFYLGSYCYAIRCARYIIPIGDWLGVVL